jgi:hypothetical protein
MIEKKNQNIYKFIETSSSYVRLDTEWPTLFNRQSTGEHRIDCRT